MQTRLLVTVLSNLEAKSNTSKAIYSIFQKAVVAWIDWKEWLNTWLRNNWLIPFHKILKNHADWVMGISIQLTILIVKRCPKRKFHCLTVLKSFFYYAKSPVFIIFEHIIEQLRVKWMQLQLLSTDLVASRTLCTNCCHISCWTSGPVPYMRWNNLPLKLGYLEGTKRAAIC